jgi:uncharacterized protein YlzI (FlbEa/FlbD family)
MIIKLTNASPEHEGKPILLNMEHVISIFETTQEISDKTFVNSTNIYTVIQQSWVVKESIETIHKKIKECEDERCAAIR